ncbi:NtrZ family periplasmic regulatory protein [Caulobacter sp. B11]|uniref:NtrZ family periplasmic regulatory protein n=1 Tax=Caulobacter sp. B11 TaxID=2048899 RepID=UPI001F2CDD76|nr:hypothetical protein [Caulobacter sp. B11]
MFAKRVFTAVVSAAILLGSASLAHAQSKPRSATTDFTVKGDFSNASQGAAPFSPQGPKKTLQWDALKGKWGLKLDLDQPVGRDFQLKDVQAGAYFRVTPSIRVGGAVALATTIPPWPPARTTIASPRPA